MTSLNETTVNPTSMPMFMGPSFPDMGQLPNQAQNAAWMQMAMSDRQQANTIWMQMLAEAQKAQQERMKILRDTQTKIFEMQQDSTNNWLATSGKSNAEFCKAIMA